MTPMIRQYLSIKDNYPDTLLFYRMGDFYEMFFDDALVASKALEITLTSRNKQDDEAIPMCGVPVRAVDNYIGRLISQGHKVAICEQVEDPATAKGIVKREVVRVLTPGMIVENQFLDEKSNNYILSINSVNGSGQKLGLSYLDISTGAFKLSETDNVAAVLDESLRVAPKEVILPESYRDNPEHFSLIRAFSNHFVTFLDDKYFEPDAGRSQLIEQFKTRSLEGFGCENARAAVGAAGALLTYVRETQKQQTEHLTSLETVPLDHFLKIDDTSCKNLELLENLRGETRKGTLLSIIDRTTTAMGARLLKQWLRYPLLDENAINGRLDAVAELKTNAEIRRCLADELKSVHDLERLTSKITMGRANARDMVALKTSLFALPSIFERLADLSAGLLHMADGEKENILPALQALANRLHAAVREDAPPTIQEGGIIKRGYNPELDELISVSRDGKQWLAKLEAKEKEQTGIPALKVKYNKVFGYYIEIPKSRAEAVPDHYVRKQTLVNAERYITDELKTFETKVLNAQEQMAALEYRLFNELREAVIENNGSLMKTAAFIARIDCLRCLAEIADQNDYTRPQINRDGKIIIEDGRHPVVEKLITGERYIPNSILMDNEENQILIITGPNMAGKSTILRQTALITILSQMGAFVPAKSAVVSITDQIFTRVGALDNLSSGQSTFMVEMEETANILNNAGPESLVIMDEIGRGTSTYDGLSIAWAVAEYLHDLKGAGVKTLFATHYHELTDLTQIKPRTQNYNIAVKEWNDEIIFLRKLVPGGTNRSYGIQVARLAGIPRNVIKKAKHVLTRIENGDAIIKGERPRQKKRTRTEGQIQLQLFRKPEEVVIKALQSLDISTMTPLEAMNHLNELKKRAELVLDS